MTEWNVYRALNDRTRVMATALERTMLFLTFIRGPNVGNWVNDQIRPSVSRHPNFRRTQNGRIHMGYSNP
jgi:hypothetical protein